ncbi:MAG: radical SAM protein [bacterium]
MKEHQIHKFSNKLLQRSVFPHLKKYISWQLGQDKFEYEANGYSFAPLSINLDLTTACNNQCPFCIDKLVLNTGKILDFNYLSGLIKKWSKDGLKSVIILGGGEPTIYPDFEKVIQLLKEHGLQIGIVTNGLQMQRIENVGDLFREKDWIRLSLDAGTDETFQRLHLPRLKITLEKILDDVSRLKKKNPKLQIGFSFLVIPGSVCSGIKLADNLGEIFSAAQKAKESGFSYLSLKPFINFDISRQTDFPADRLEELKSQVKKAKEECDDENFKVMESVNLLALLEAKDLENQEKCKTCHYQFFRLAVMPDGVFICPLWRGVKLKEARIQDANREINDEYFSELHKNRVRAIKEFNAQKICAHSFCLPNSSNQMIDELIKNKQVREKLGPIDDFNDYFL